MISTQNYAIFQNPSSLIRNMLEHGGGPEVTRVLDEWNGWDGWKSEPDFFEEVSAQMRNQQRLEKVILQAFPELAERISSFLEIVSNGGKFAPGASGKA